MTHEVQIHRLDWQGIAIEIRWNPEHHSGSGFEIAHLELMTEPRQRLPMTETGYRSHFVHREQVEVYESPVAYVRAWLEEEAASTDWLKYVEDSKQLSLF